MPNATEYVWLNAGAKQECNCIVRNKKVYVSVHVYVISNQKQLKKSVWTFLVLETLFSSSDFDITVKQELHSSHLCHSS